MYFGNIILTYRTLLKKASILLSFSWPIQDFTRSSALVEKDSGAWGSSEGQAKADVFSAHLASCAWANHLQTPLSRCMSSVATIALLG